MHYYILFICVFGVANNQLNRCGSIWVARLSLIPIDTTFDWDVMSSQACICSGCILHIIYFICKQIFVISFIIHPFSIISYMHYGQFRVLMVVSWCYFPIDTFIVKSIWPKINSKTFPITRMSAVSTHSSVYGSLCGIFLHLTRMTAHSH